MGSSSVSLKVDDTWYACRFSPYSVRTSGLDRVINGEGTEFIIYAKNPSEREYYYVMVNEDTLVIPPHFKDFDRITRFIRRTIVCSDRTAYCYVVDLPNGDKGITFVYQPQYCQDVVFELELDKGESDILPFENEEENKENDAAHQNFEEFLASTETRSNLMERSSDNEKTTSNPTQKNDTNILSSILLPKFTLPNFCSPDFDDESFKDKKTKAKNKTSQFVKNVFNELLKFLDEPTLSKTEKEKEEKKEEKEEEISKEKGKKEIPVQCKSDSTLYLTHLLKKIKSLETRVAKLEKKNEKMKQTQPKPIIDATLFDKVFNFILESNSKK